MKAIKENMEYTFTPVSVKDDRIEVDLYNTIYVLIRDKEENWSNADNNKFEMSDSLARAIVQSLGKT